MITLYMVRHGETMHNLHERIQGHTDSPLTQLGKKQAHAIGERMSREQISAIYSSDLGRALATAEAIAVHHHLPVQPTDLLREANLGLVQGLSVKEFEERYPEEFRLWRLDSSKNRPPGAEPLENVIERCGEFIRMIRDKHKDGEKLLAVLHGGSLRGLVCAVLGMPASLFSRIHSSNASLSILQIGERCSISLLNDICHLSGLRVTDEETDNAPTQGTRHGISP